MTARSSRRARQSVGVGADGNRTRTPSLGRETCAATAGDTGAARLRTSAGERRVLQWTGCNSPKIKNTLALNVVVVKHPPGYTTQSTQTGTPLHPAAQTPAHPATQTLAQSAARAPVSLAA